MTAPVPVGDRLAPAAGLVVLVHGLWMGASACALLAGRLRARGLHVVSFPYRSVKHTLEETAERLFRFVTGLGTAPAHFVGHSLGGLVVLATLARHPALSAARVVLLGSPANGCEAAAQLQRSAHGRLLLGAALPGWKPERARGVTRRLEVGAIAGNRRFGLGMLFVRLDGENDGVVGVEETRLPGLRDHLVLPVTHTGMLVSGRVAGQVAAFLAGGRFVRQPQPSL